MKKIYSPANNFILNSQPLTSVEKKRYVVIIKDITTEKEISTLKEDFVATLTHDLKVPIIAAANMIDLFLARKFGDISEKQEFALHSMKSSNTELLDLVQILLETYKIKERGIELVKENLSLNSFVQDVVNEMNTIAADAGMEIIFNQDNENPKVNADSMQLARVVKNLIFNAINHSQSKKAIEVTVGTMPDFATICVTDYGQGISQEEIKMIFNKYYSAAKKLRKVGTGLGLYLSQQIAQAHGGEITVKSEENVKTEFCVKIPFN